MAQVEENCKNCFASCTQPTRAVFFLFEKSHLLINGMVILHLR
jgi:hypothetical protein